MHCREILFTPRCSLKAREFPRSVNFSVRRMVAELRGVKVAQFSDFGLFSPYKMPKKVPSGDQPTAQGLHHRMIRFFHMIVEGPKGCLPAAVFSCDWGPVKLPKFSPMSNGYIHTDLDQRCQKTHRSAVVAFIGGYHQISLLLPPKKIHPKTPFWGTFQCKTYYIERSP